MAIFQNRTTRINRYQNATILVFIAALMIAVVVKNGAIRRAKLQSNHHHQQTNTQLSTDRMPFLLPNQQCQSTEGRTVSYSMDWLIPSSPDGFPSY